MQNLDSVKWWPFYVEKITLLYFSLSPFWLLQRNFAGTGIAAFPGSEIRFFAHFSKSVLVTPTKLGRDIASGKGYPVCEFDCNVIGDGMDIK